MRILGLEIHRRKPEAQKAASPVSRPGWSSPFGAILGGYVPLRADLELYRAIREGIPVVDAAIDKLIRLSGRVRARAPDGGEDRLSAQINAFLDSVKVNAFQQGFATYLNNFLGDLLTYGRGAGEMVPDTARRDLFALVNIDARTIRVLPGTTVFDARLVQVGTGPYRPARGDSPFSQPLPRDLTLYALRA